MAGSILIPTLGETARISRRDAVRAIGGTLALGKLSLAKSREFLETEENIEGPFYKKGAPARSNLVDKGMKGIPFELTGRVYSTRGEALSGAVLDVWQADDGGNYDNSGYTLRGVVTVNANGAYTLETILPKHYQTGPNSYRPAHIHLKLRAPGCAELTTQLYFRGDQYNEADAFVRPSLMLSPKESAGGKKASFDFVLRAV